MQDPVPVAENELIGGGKEVNNEGLGSYFPQKKMLRQGFQGLDSIKIALSEDSGKGRQERGGGQAKVQGPRGPASFWTRMPGFTGQEQKANMQVPLLLGRPWNLPEARHTEAGVKYKEPINNT